MTCKQVNTRHTHTLTLQRKCLRIKSVRILDAFWSGYHHWSLFESHSHTLYWKKPWHKTRLVTLQVPKNGHHIHQVKDSLLCHWMVHIYLSIDCDFMKTNLNNYNGIIKPRKHMQNMWSIPELVTQDIDVMYIILMTTLRGYT
jgi:hypothetical protein